MSQTLTTNKIEIRVDKTLLADLAAFSHGQNISIEAAIQRAIRMWLAAQTKAEEAKHD